MNDCPRQNPAYRLTQIFSTLTHFQDHAGVTRFLRADQINFFLFFNNLKPGLNA